MVIDTVALEKGLRVHFNMAYEAMLRSQMGANLMRLITEVPSTASEEKYGWLGDVPAVKEWLGDKEAAGIADYDYTIKNKDWYAAIAIDRNELEDDQVGMIPPRLDFLVQSLAMHKWELVSDLIINGTTNLAYDSTAFFANRAAPNDNLLAGTGTTLAQIKTDITTARAAMMKFESDTGRVLGLLMDAIVCPPEIEGTMLEAVDSTINPVNTAGANPVNRWINAVIVDPRLSDADDWYGFATQMPLKPFIFQSRKNPTPVLDDSEVKRNRKLTYSAEARNNAGYGFFQMAVKVVN